MSEIPAGEILTGATVTSGETLTVYGTAEQTTVLSGGSMKISRGGVANSATIEGALRVYKGGTITNFSVVGDKANAQVQVGGVDDPKAVVTNATVDGATSGVLRLSGALATSTTLNAGSIVIAEGTTATTTVVNGGKLSVGGKEANIASSIDATVKAGASMVVLKYSDVKDTIVDGGRLYLSEGAMVTDTVLKNGGKLSAYISATDAQIIRTTVSEGATIVLSAGTATDTELLAGGSMHVLAGATAENTHVYKGASVFAVSDGATIIGTTLDAVDDEKAFILSATMNANTTTVGKGWVISAFGKADGMTFEEGASLKVKDGAVISNLEMKDGSTLAVSAGATIVDAAIGKLTSRVEIASGATATNVTVGNGGIFYVRHGAAVSNLNILAGGSAWSIYDVVNGGTIAGEVNLKPESAGALNGIVLREGAKVYNNGGDVFVVSESVAPTGDEPAPVKDDIDLTNGGIFAYNDESGAKQTRLATGGDLFLNGNTVTMSALSLDFGTNTTASLYAGKSFDEDTTNLDGSSNLTFNGIDMGTHTIFGGGKITAGFSEGTITGDISMVAYSGVADRLYAGYDVQKSNDATLEISGDTELAVRGGSYKYIRGGIANSTVLVSGNASTSLESGSVASLVGDYQVGAGAEFTREGNTVVVVDAKTSTTKFENEATEEDIDELINAEGVVRYSVAVDKKSVTVVTNDVAVTGTLAGAGVSFGGEYKLDGSSSITISGGTIKGSIFGGVTIGSTGAVAISEKCEITGDVDITIDCSENAVVIGNADNKVTSIFAGSYAKGIVGGDAALTLKGDCSNLQLVSAEDGVVEFIGDSTLATNRKGYVKGSSSLVFDGFTCEGKDVLNVQNIAGFDTIEFKNGSKVQIGYLDTLADVDTWKFNAVDGQTVFKVENLQAANDFAGDTIDIAFDDTTLNSCTLMDMGDSADWSTGLSDSIVKFNGTEAIWNGSDAFVADGFSLSVVDDKSLVLSKLA